MRGRSVRRNFHTRPRKKARGRTRRDSSCSLLAGREKARCADGTARDARQQAGRQKVVVGNPQCPQDEWLQNDEADACHLKVKSSAHESQLKISAQAAETHQSRQR